MTLTISEALGWMKTLQARHNELVNLRNENSHAETRYLGANATPLTKTPVYDVKKLDTMITKIATEIRKLDQAIKKANAKSLGSSANTRSRLPPSAVL